MLNIFRSILQHFGADESNHFLDPFSDSSTAVDQTKHDGQTECIETTQNSKHVTFHNKIKVVLVPTAMEYQQAGCDLWWNERDYYFMRESFREEIETLLKHDSSLQNNIFSAMKKLYQPGESIDLTWKKLDSSNHRMCNDNKNIIKICVFNDRHNCINSHGYS